MYPPEKVEFYPNYGYGLLGAVIEEVTGERFEKYMTEHVLIPLQIAHSTFDQPLPSTADMVPGKWFISMPHRRRRSSRQPTTCPGSCRSHSIREQAQFPASLSK